MDIKKIYALRLIENTTQTMIDNCREGETIEEHFQQMCMSLAFLSGMYSVDWQFIIKATDESSDFSNDRLLSLILKDAGEIYFYEVGSEDEQKDLITDAIHLANLYAKQKLNGTFKFYAYLAMKESEVIA